MGSIPIGAVVVAIDTVGVALVLVLVLVLAFLIDIKVVVVLELLIDIKVVGVAHVFLASVILPAVLRRNSSFIITDFANE